MQRLTRKAWTARSFKEPDVTPAFRKLGPFTADCGGATSFHADDRYYGEVREAGDVYAVAECLEDSEEDQDSDCIYVSEEDLRGARDEHEARAALATYQAVRECLRSQRKFRGFHGKGRGAWRPRWVDYGVEEGAAARAPEKGSSSTCACTSTC